MVSEELQNALEQNHENLRILLTALDADYEMEEDPAKQAAMGSLFHPNPEARVERAKDAEMSDEEWTAWLFEENAKALAAAVEAAGGDPVNPSEVTESKGMAEFKKALGGR